MTSRHIALAALIAASGLAQAQQGWTEIDDDTILVQQLGMTIDQVEEGSVYDSTGERIGEVDDVLIGADGSSMAVSLDVGGFIGIGEKDVVIPVDDLSPTENGFSVNMTREQLEALPEYED